MKLDGFEWIGSVAYKYTLIRSLPIMMKFIVFIATEVLYLLTFNFLGLKSFSGVVFNSQYTVVDDSVWGCVKRETGPQHQ